MQQRDGVEGQGVKGSKKDRGKGQAETERGNKETERRRDNEKEVVRQKLR